MDTTDTSRHAEFGVFMPVASNGFLFSTAAPRFEPSFGHNRDVARLAEQGGLDFAFWMGKWRGYGGTTGFWDQSLEPLTLATAVAASTERIRLFATVSPLLLHPAVAAKTIATADECSGGRFGINVVTGNTLDEYLQMGLVPDGYDGARYEYAEEWCEVVKRLWAEDSVTFDGRFFHLADCVSRPKPARRPTIVCAGLSDEGLAFTARQADYSFVGNASPAVAKVRELAARAGRGIRVVTNLFVVQDSTDGRARARFDRIRAGLDTEALDNVIAGFTRSDRSSYEFRTHFLRAPDTVGFGTGTTVTGSAETVAERIVAEVVDNDIDSVQFTFPDYLPDLEALCADVLPIVRERLARQGITTGEGSRRG
ncbi:LLM class flavin-dependent oxidoreductase [Amycolatopsis sp. NPDC059027]|uniref:LLM class flavin-dependent oxidoreductase n=1 Tax=Amycolatopsis sp. NPDC059027 TaxID=3346709 RepID=UPI003671230D